MFVESDARLRGTGMRRERAASAMRRRRWDMSSARLQLRGEGDRRLSGFRTDVCARLVDWGRRGGRGVRSVKSASMGLLGTVVTVVLSAGCSEEKSISSGDAGSADEPAIDGKCP